MKRLNEISSEYKKEAIILYKDSNLICMIPKSQVASNVYGSGASWCQRQKTGFDMWAQKSIFLIRFLFKTGRKIRFTLDARDKGREYYWSSEDGYHILKGYGDPFLAKPAFSHKVRDKEKDILELIKLIPDKCKANVNKFIEENLDFEYIHREENYLTNRQKMRREQLNNIGKEWKDKLDKMNLNVNISTNSSFFNDNNDKSQFTLYGHYKNSYIELGFNNIIDLKNKIDQLWNDLELNEKYGIDDDYYDIASQVFERIDKNKRNKLQFTWTSKNKKTVKTIVETYLEKNPHNPNMFGGLFKKNWDSDKDRLAHIFIFMTKDRSDDQITETIAHELKHVDYALNKKEGGFFSDNRMTIQKKYTNNKKFNVLSDILYLFDRNEFESQYISIFYDFLKYAILNLSKNPSIEDVRKLFKEFEGKNTSLYVYMKMSRTFDKINKGYKLGYKLDTTELISDDIIYLLIKDKDINTLSINELIKSLMYIIKKNVKTKFGLYTKEDKEKINRFRDKFFAKLNVYSSNYRKKLYRIIPAVYHKITEQNAT